MPHPQNAAADTTGTVDSTEAALAQWWLGRGVELPEFLTANWPRPATRTALRVQDERRAS